MPSPPMQYTAPPPPPSQPGLAPRGGDLASAAPMVDSMLAWVPQEYRLGAAAGAGGLLMCGVCCICVCLCFILRRRRRRPKPTIPEAQTPVARISSLHLGLSPGRQATAVRASVGRGGVLATEAVSARRSYAAMLEPPEEPTSLKEYGKQTRSDLELVEIVSTVSVAPPPPSTPPPPPPPPPTPPSALPSHDEPPSPAANADSTPKKIDGMAMATYLMPPTTEPPIAVGAIVQLGAGKRAKRWALKSAFGAPLHDYALTSCYDCMAPRLLVAMWCALIRAGGLFQEGIFRLAPDSAHTEKVEKALAKGKLDWDGTPAVALAHLIKKFLRLLPGGLLGGVALDDLAACGKDAAACEALVQNLEPLARDTLRFLIRGPLCLTAECESKNKMGLRNLALVLAPNMFGPPSTGKAAAPSVGAVEELMRVEHAANALHALASAQQGRI